MVDVMSINRTISLERLFVVYYHDRDWSGTYVYPEEMLHINTWMDEGWIKFVPTPQVSADWNTRYLWIDIWMILLYTSLNPIIGFTK